MPVVGTLIFIPVLVASFGIDFGGLGIVGLTPPASAAPAIRETATTFHRGLAGRISDLPG